MQAADQGTGAYTLSGWDNCNVGNGNDLDWLRAIGLHLHEMPQSDNQSISAYQRWTLQDARNLNWQDNRAVRAKEYEVNLCDVLARQYIDMKAELSHLRLYDQVQGNKNLLEYGRRAIAQAQCNQIKNLSRIYELYLQDDQLEQEEQELRQRMQSKKSYLGYPQLVRHRRDQRALQQQQAEVASFLQDQSQQSEPAVEPAVISEQDDITTCALARQNRLASLRKAAKKAVSIRQALAPFPDIFPTVPRKRSSQSSAESPENALDLNCLDLQAAVSELSTQELIRAMSNDDNPKLPALSVSVSKRAKNDTVVPASFKAWFALMGVTRRGATEAVSNQPVSEDIGIPSQDVSLHAAIDLQESDLDAWMTESTNFDDAPMQILDRAAATAPITTERETTIDNLMQGLGNCLLEYSPVTDSSQTASPARKKLHK